MKPYIIGIYTGGPTIFLKGNFVGWRVENRYIIGIPTGQPTKKILPI